MTMTTQSTPGGWVDARQPLPKHGDNIKPLNKTSEGEAHKSKIDPVYKLAHDCGIPLAGAKMLVLMLADMQNQIEELKTEVQQLKAK